VPSVLGATLRVGVIYSVKLGLVYFGTPGVVQNTKDPSTVPLAIEFFQRE